MNVKKTLAIFLAIAMLFSSVMLFGCGKPAAETPASGTDAAAAESQEASGPDYDNMSMDELYQLAKQETGKITIYSTTTTAQTAVK